MRALDLHSCLIGFHVMCSNLPGDYLRKQKMEDLGEFCDIVACCSSWRGFKPSVGEEISDCSDATSDYSIVLPAATCGRAL